MRPEPVFEEPWHAQVFALTVAMNEAGHVSWPDWAAYFGAALARHGLDRELNGGSDYFAAWLDALEQILTERGFAQADAIEALRGQWEHAFLTTPHGAPVTLPK